MKKSVIAQSFFIDIRTILENARQKAYSAVNFAMVEAYWQIGKRIVEEEQQGKNRAGYGEHLIRELSKSLTSEFGKGFSLANLWNFRQFYQTFPDEQILYTLCRELNWSQLRLIMRVENPQQGCITFRKQEKCAGVFASLKGISILFITNGFFPRRTNKSR